MSNFPLHHVGIVQPDEEAVAVQMALLGLTESYRGYVPQFQALCIFTEPPGGGTAGGGTAGGGMAGGGSPIEFVVADGGSLTKFNKGAGGIHHIAFQVPDIAALTAEFADQGIRMIEPEAVKGAGDFLCNFLSPVATRGVIVEYVQLI